MAIGKRLNKAREGVDREKLYPLADAIKMVKERAKAKFDETIEVAINLGVDPRHADQMVRGVVTLPNGTGRTLRVGRQTGAGGMDVVGRHPHGRERCAQLVAHVRDETGLEAGDVLQFADLLRESVGHAVERFRQPPEVVVGGDLGDPRLEVAGGNLLGNVPGTLDRPELTYAIAHILGVRPAVSEQ